MTRSPARLFEKKVINRIRQQYRKTMKEILLKDKYNNESTTHSLDLNQVCDPYEMMIKKRKMCV